MNKPRPLCASSGGSMARATCAGMGSRRPSSVISNRSRTGGSPSVRTVTRTAPPGSPDAVCLIALVKSSLTTSSTESRMLGYARSRERTKNAPGRSSRPFRKVRVAWIRPRASSLMGITIPGVAPDHGGAATRNQFTTLRNGIPS